jgi:hypothetical protein
MKESSITFYLKHDINARNDLKVRRLRRKYNSEGYGVYWMLIEILVSNNGKIEFIDVPGIAEDEKLNPEKLIEIIAFCTSENCGLFKSDNKGFWSDRVNEYLEQRNSFIEAGKLGALKRWGHKKNTPPNREGSGGAYSNKEINKEINKKEAINMTSEERNNYLNPENLKNLQIIFKDNQTLKTHLINLDFSEAEIDQALGKNF